MYATPGSVRSPAPGQNPTRRSERIHYDQDGVTVTSRWLQVHGRRYPLADLYRVWTVRGPFPSRPVDGALLGTIVTAATVPVWSQFGGLAGIATLAVLAVTGGAGILYFRLTNRPHLMIGELYGRRILLHSDRDGLRYGKIIRAIQRAQEAQRW